MKREQIIIILGAVAMCLVLNACGASSSGTAATPFTTQAVSTEPMSQVSNVQITQGFELNEEGGSRRSATAYLQNGQFVQAGELNPNEPYCSLSMRGHSHVDAAILSVSSASNRHSKGVGQRGMTLTLNSSSLKSITCVNATNGPDVPPTVGSIAQAVGPLMLFN